jgi:hypothetical protein
MKLSNFFILSALLFFIAIPAQALEGGDFQPVKTCETPFAEYLVNRVATDEAARALWENFGSEAKEVKKGAWLKHWVEPAKKMEIKVLRIDPELFSEDRKASASLGVDPNLDGILFQEPIYVAQILATEKSLVRAEDGFHIFTDFNHKKEPTVFPMTFDPGRRQQYYLTISDAKGPFIQWETYSNEKNKIFFTIPYTRGMALLPVPRGSASGSGGPNVIVNNNASTLWGDVKSLVGAIFDPRYSSGR